MVLLETLQFTPGLQLHEFVIFLLHITAAAFDHFFGPAGKHNMLCTVISKPYMHNYKLNLGTKELCSTGVIILALQLTDEDVKLAGLPQNRLDKLVQLFFLSRAWF